MDHFIFFLLMTLCSACGITLFLLPPQLPFWEEGATRQPRPVVHQSCVPGLVTQCVCLSLTLLIHFTLTPHFLPFWLFTVLHLQFMLLAFYHPVKLTACPCSLLPVPHSYLIFSMCLPFYISHTLYYSHTCAVGCSACPPAGCPPSSSSPVLRMDWISSPPSLQEPSHCLPHLHFPTLHFASTSTSSIPSIGYSLCLLMAILQHARCHWFAWPLPCILPSGCGWFIQRITGSNMTYRPWTAGGGETSLWWEHNCLSNNGYRTLVEDFVQQRL